MEQRYLPTSNAPEVENPPICIPTFVTPAKEEEKEEISTPESTKSLDIKRRGSGSSFAFCLPMTCSGDNDDPYEMLINNGNTEKGDFLSVNDRFVSG